MTMRDVIPATDTLMLKRCNSCHRWLEATPENFHRNRRNPDGLANSCKLCATAASVCSHAKRRARLKEARS